MAGALGIGPSEVRGWLLGRGVALLTPCADRAADMRGSPCPCWDCEAARPAEAALAQALALEPGDFGSPLCEVAGCPVGGPGP